MSESKLMTPLFCDGAFNQENRRMRSIFVREVSNGKNTYNIWRSAGNPDNHYPRNDKDRYYLYVELNSRLFPLGLTEYNLAAKCGRELAVKKLYGDSEQRGKYFDALRRNSSGECPDILEAFKNEDQLIQEIGETPELWADFIQKKISWHVEEYLDCRDKNGRFPDFVGALALGELELCCKLRDKRNADFIAHRLEQEQREKAAEKQRQNAINEGTGKKLEKAIGSLRNSGFIDNEAIELYDENGNHIERSIMLHLLKVNNIAVPLRTQGWIEEKLAAVTIRDGHCVSVRFRKSKGARVSEKSFECIDALIQKVTAMNTAA